MGLLFGPSGNSAAPSPSFPLSPGVPSRRSLSGALLERMSLVMGRITAWAPIADGKTIFLLTILCARCVNASQHTSASFLELEFRRCNGRTTFGEQGFAVLPVNSLAPARMQEHFEAKGGFPGINYEKDNLEFNHCVRKMQRKMDVCRFVDAGSGALPAVDYHARRGTNRG